MSAYRDALLSFDTGKEREDMPQTGGSSENCVSINKGDINPSSTSQRCRDVLGGKVKQVVDVERPKGARVPGIGKKCCSGSPEMEAAEVARMAFAPSSDPQIPPLKLTFFLQPPSSSHLTPHTMSDTIQELADIPKDFVREGSLFIKRCTKPDKREFIKISQAVGMGFLVMVRVYLLPISLPSITLLYLTSDLLTRSIRVPLVTSSS